MTGPRRTARAGIAVRITVAAAVLAAVLLTGGALLVRAALHSSQMAATQQLAEAQASQIIDATRQNVLLSGAFGSLPYELVRSDGVVVAASPDLAETDGPVFPTPASDATQAAGEVWSATITGGPLSGRTLTAVSSTLRATSIPGFAQGEIPGSPVADVESTTYRAYVLVSTTAADRAVATIDPYLWAGVVVIVALMATTAALTAKRSLRPVDRMRRAAEAISGAPGGARLAVPDTDDELRALATTLNAMLERIDDAAIRQERFVADAAHELRSPITSLITAVEVARAHPGVVPAERTLAHVHLEARRLEQLAGDLLELSAAGRATHPDDRRSGVHEVLRDAVAHAPARSPRVEIRTGELVGHDAAEVRIGSRELSRVFGNLLDNAVRHARTLVETRVDVDAVGVRIEIANDGEPIPGVDLARIFEPFVRLDDSRARETGGTGLGLSIAREIVSRAGGTLTVASTSSRTAFTVDLPAAAAS
ncbi:signal transduction histidine kinase [Microbacterium sp. AG1240]|uniref:sensor histidine kinase n=1 Tax=Microbacterium sp. AG1240 TaxID=2183992 RepID=UPI000EAB9F14|nr:ATP-binding protein [Microbacterium sp. AG1240]RKT33302.1 signal transduction histidine kinase [Microbacterium sp. AG1240]